MPINRVTDGLVRNTGTLLANRLRRVSFHNYPIFKTNDINGINPGSPEPSGFFSNLMKP